MLEDLLAFDVISANDQYRGQVAKLAQIVQEVTAINVDIAYGD